MPNNFHYKIREKKIFFLNIGKVKNELREALEMLYVQHIQNMEVIYSK